MDIFAESLSKLVPEARIAYAHGHVDFAAGVLVWPVGRHCPRINGKIRLPQSFGIAHGSINNKSCQTARLAKCRHNFASHGPFRIARAGYYQHVAGSGVVYSIVQQQIFTCWQIDGIGCTQNAVVVKGLER